MSKKSAKKKRRSTLRRSQVETLESREVMSADPLGGLLGGAISHHAIQEDAEQPLMLHGQAELTQPGGFDYSHHADPNADFWLDEQPQITLEEQLDQIEKSLASAHQLTGMDHVKTDYGFSGIGQTVAVIDSGIAYDHYALGGGYGSNYRVVGGYDFTELDSNPYDDGAEGSHGTHVAGIVGANDGNRSGVAPGVDLVGLRVFSDSGAGYFSWVESALQWVHANRNSFENPITAVNLSLGTSWNSSSIPAWATLENEFAQLEADGIFISVSAGNSYSTYNTPGLSYPAASPYVVPVMSSDDSGFLSYFSQRHDRAIAAPGRYIYSTIPDYAGNNNGITDDWANFSGTSMAAPYVAGASVIIREAMEFVGMTGITQDVIYDHMIATADTFYDSTSGAYYNRLNVQSAIDALMPEDDFGSSVETAYNLGTVNAGLGSNAAPMAGHIEKLSDSDYFTFTAGATGTVTFTAANTTHNMAAAWVGAGAVGDGGSSFTMNVTAGQQYTIGLASGDGLGYYDLMVTAESAFTFVDWGAAGVQETRSGINLSGESFYRVQAGRDGYVTVQALQTAGIAGVDLLNAAQQVVATGSGGRVDYYAQAGEELYLRVSGSASGVDFRVTNAVSVVGGVVDVLGTDGTDAVTFSAGAIHALSLNGVDYSFATTAVAQFDFDGGGGADSIILTGAAEDESAELRVGSASLSASGYVVQATGFKSVSVYSGGGADTATLYDSGAADRLITSPTTATLRAMDNAYSHSVHGFRQVYAYATPGGDDEAHFYDGDTDDRFLSGDHYAFMKSLTGEFYNYAAGFDSNHGFSTGAGYDIGTMYDSAGDDRFIGNPGSAIMEAMDGGYYNYAKGFQETYGYSTAGGDDRALQYDSAQDDVLVAYKNKMILRGDGYYNSAIGFATNTATATSGTDIAYMYDSAAADRFIGTPTYAVMRAEDVSYFNYAAGFDQAFGYAINGGFDTAQLNGGATDDRFVGRRDYGLLRSVTGEFYNYVSGFESLYANGGSGGIDYATYYDSVGNDTFSAGKGNAVLSDDIESYRIETTGFDGSYAYSTAGGDDKAVLTDSAMDDALTAQGDYALLVGDGVRTRTTGFDTVEAHSVNGGADTVDEGALDFVFTRLGAWS